MLTTDSTRCRRLSVGSGAAAGIGDSPEGIKGRVNDFGALKLVAATALWILLFPSLVPSVDTDYGIFASVADRLLAGDILYKQVFDNKEPFVYYFVAVQREIGPVGPLIAEILWLLLAVIAAYFLASRLADKRAAMVTGFIAVPIILTGAFYVPGYTHLPGTSLCLAAYALALRGRLTLAGLATGILLFTKLIMAPVAGALVACERFGGSCDAKAWKLPAALLGA